MSTLKVSTLQNLSGTEVYTAKAWVNFNGTGTVAIRASGNVSSITDNGTGDYTVNFTNAMPDTNYSYSLSGSFNDGTNDTTMFTFQGRRATAPTSSALRVVCIIVQSAAAVDVGIYNVAIFR